MSTFRPRPLSIATTEPNFYQTDGGANHHHNINNINNNTDNNSSNNNNNKLSFYSSTAYDDAAADEEERGAGKATRISPPPARRNREVTPLPSPSQSQSGLIVQQHHHHHEGEGLTSASAFSGGGGGGGGPASQANYHRRLNNERNSGNFTFTGGSSLPSSSCVPAAPENHHHLNNNKNNNNTITSTNTNNNNSNSVFCCGNGNNTNGQPYSTQTSSVATMRSTIGGSSLLCDNDSGEFDKFGSPHPTAPNTNTIIINNNNNNNNHNNNMPVNYSSNSMSTLGCSKNASSGPDSGKLNSAYISVVSNGRSLGLLPSASTEEFESGHGNASGCFSGGCGGLGSSLSGSDQRLSVCSRMKRSMPPAFDLGKVDAVRESSFVPNSDNPSRFDYTGDYEAGGTCNAATCFPMSRIAPYIYVGSWRDAGDAELLRKHGITFILNVAEELDPASESAMIRQHDPRTIQSLSIPMKDNLHQDLGKGLTDAFAFIERARAARPPQSRDVDDGYAGGRVLVHCRRGISRSPAIVVAYLMATQGWSFRRASHYVKHRRPCISLNLAFQEKLRELRAEPKWRHASHELLSSDRSGSAPSDDDGEDEDEDERSSRSGHGGSDNEEEEVDCDAPAWASRSRRDRSSHHNAHNHNHKFLCRTGENSNSKDGDVASPHTATMVGSGSTPRCFTHTNTATTDCGFDDDDGSSPFSPLVRGKPRAGGAGGGGGGKASAGFSAFGNDSSDEEE